MSSAPLDPAVHAIADRPSLRTGDPRCAMTFGLVWPAADHQVLIQPADRLANPTWSPVGFVGSSQRWLDADYWLYSGGAMAHVADDCGHEPKRFGGQTFPPKRSSAELLERCPEMPRPETLHHSERPLTDEERALRHDLLYR